MTASIIDGCYILFKKHVLPILSTFLLIIFNIVIMAAMIYRAFYLVAGLIVVFLITIISIHPFEIS